MAAQQSDEHLRSEEHRRLVRRRGVAIVAVIAAAAFAVVVWLGGRDSNKLTDSASQDSPSATSPAAAADGAGAVEVGRHDSIVVRRDPNDAMAIGKLDAPVVIVEWLDTRCPFCAHFSRDTLPGLMADYVDTGLVRYEVRDVAFFGDQSIDGAVAARAAGEQGMFHEFLTTVYAAAPDRGHPELTRTRLLELAEQAGIPDLARFEAALQRPDLRQAVDHSTWEAGSLGVNSVPFFVVGKTVVAGAQPDEVFREVIDEALAEALGQ